MEGSEGEVAFAWYELTDEDEWTKLDEAPSEAGDYKVVATVAADANHEAAAAELGFTIYKVTSGGPSSSTGGSSTGATDGSQDDQGRGASRHGRRDVPLCIEASLTSALTAQMCRNRGPPDPRPPGRARRV